MFKKTLIAVGLTAMAGSAFAAEMPKGEVSLGLTEVAGEQGFDLGLNVDLYKGLYFNGSYADLESGSELKEYGLGYAHAVSEKVGLVGELSYLDVEVNGVEDDALVTKLGFEVAALDGLNLDFGAERLHWDDMDTSGTDFYLGVSAKVTNDISVSVNHRAALEQTGVSVSWSF